MQHITFLVIRKRQNGVRQLYCTGHCVISVLHGPFLKVTVGLFCRKVCCHSTQGLLIPATHWPRFQLGNILLLDSECFKMMVIPVYLKSQGFLQPIGNLGNIPKLEMLIVKIKAGKAWKFNNMLGKPLSKRSAVQMEFCQIAFQPPPPSSKRTLCGNYFRRKSVNFLKQRFWLWELIFWQWLWSHFVLRWYSDGYHDW